MLHFIKKNLHIWLAIALLGISQADIWSQITFDNGYTWVWLWYCHIMATLLSVAFLLRSSLLASIVLVSAMPSQFMWIVDFIMLLLGLDGQRTAWILNTNLNAWWTPHLSLLLHVIIIPLAIIAVWRFGFNNKSLKYSIALATVVLAASYLFTDPYVNINCVFYPCDLRWPMDKTIIESNPLYFSVSYLLKEILYWTTVGMLNFAILSYIFSKLLKK